jgi:hypothetical protein
LGGGSQGEPASQQDILRESMMRLRLVRVLVAASACWLLASCNLKHLVPFAGRGSVHVFVTYVEAEPQRERTKVYVDEFFYGHLPEEDLILNLPEGEHLIEVRCPGFVTYRTTMFVAREPNQQVLYVKLREGQDMPAEPGDEQPPAEQEP